MWHVFDPMAETQSSFTPYHYCYNNPVNLVDPLGLDPDGLGNDFWNWIRSLLYNGDRTTQKGKKSRGSRGGGSGPGDNEYSPWPESDDNFGNVVVGAQTLSFEDWLKVGEMLMKAYVGSMSSQAGMAADAARYLGALNNNVDSYDFTFASAYDRIDGYYRSFSKPKQLINLQGNNVITQLTDAFKEIHNNNGINPRTGMNYHLSDFIDVKSVPEKSWFTKIFGNMRNDGVGGVSSFGDKIAEWYIPDRNFMQNYQENYIAYIYPDNPTGSNIYRIRAMFNNETRISITFYDYDLFKAFYDKIFN